MSSKTGQEYLSLKKKHKDEILFFQIGEFYEIMFDDAIIASSKLNINLTTRGTFENLPIPLCGIPKHVKDLYIKRLLNQNHKVALYEQSDQGFFRVKSRIYTPGTVTEEVFVDKKDSNFIMCVVNVGVCFEVCVADISTGQTYLEHTNDLESLIEQYRPCEILVCQDYKQLAEWKGIITKIDVFDAAVKGLKNYLDYTKCSFIIKVEDKALDKVMFINRNSRVSLELVETIEGVQKGSLFDYINKTKTAMGYRCLFKQIQEPLTDEAKISKRLDKVEFFVKNAGIAGIVSEALSKVGDIERGINRISAGSAKKQDYVNILVGLKNGCVIGVSNQDQIIKALDFVGGRIKEGLAGENIINNCGGFRDKINQVLTRIQILEKSFGFKIKHQSSLGYFIQVSNRDVNKVPYNFKHIQTLSDCRRYTTDALTEMNLNLLQAQSDLAKLEEFILSEIKDYVNDNIDFFRQFCLDIAQIDMLVALAQVSSSFVRPKFVSKIGLKVKSGFYRQGFVENDTELGEQVMFLTGPNMSGKSTYMRQNAHIIILAQIGCFVPAAECELSIADAIYTRIGAYDDISNGKSTFMCEMSELASILNNVTERSFVILDEIGRGTTPREGKAIAIAVLEYMLDKVKSRVIFASHFNVELKGLVYRKMESEGIGVDSVKYLYKVGEGVSSYSYGIAVAKEAGLKDVIIKRALELTDNGG